MLSFNTCSIVTLETIIMGPIKKARCRSGTATSFFPCNLCSKAPFLYLPYDFIYWHMLNRWVRGFLVQPMIHSSWSWVGRVRICTLYFCFIPLFVMFKSILFSKISTDYWGEAFGPIIYLPFSCAAWQGQNQILS